MNRSQGVTKFLPPNKNPFWMISLFLTRLRSLSFRALIPVVSAYRFIRGLSLSNWANLATILGFTLAVLGIWQVAQDQRVARQYEAWQTISLAEGKAGNAGRIDALQDLNRYLVSLNGIDVSGAYLSHISLLRARLTDANFTDADLAFSSFANAVLIRADFSNADLTFANFSYSDAIGVNLSGAILIGSDLRRASLAAADLSNANLAGANLDSADLSLADLDHALLSLANLRNADLVCASLQGADLSGATLESANLFGAVFSDADLFKANMLHTNLSVAQLASSGDWRGATLPEDLHHFELPINVSEAEADCKRTLATAQSYIAPKPASITLSMLPRSLRLLPHLLDSLRATDSHLATVPPDFIDRLVGDTASLRSLVRVTAAGDLDRRLIDSLMRHSLPSNSQIPSP